MPALGSNINAALGRIDYSPIARGGESMARGIAQAGQVKGQTYASIGQNISQGIQKYQKNQLEKKEQEGARNMLEKALADPRLANALNLSPGDDNAYDKGELNAIIASAGGRQNLAAFLNQGQEMSAQQEFRKAQMDEMAANARYRDASAINALRIDPVVGALMSQKQFDELIAKGIKVEGIPTADGSVRVTKVGSSSGSPTTNINLGENRFADNVADLTTEAGSNMLKGGEEGIKSVNQIDKVIKEISESTFESGLLADIRTLGNKIMGQVFDDEAAMKRATDAEFKAALLGSEVFQLFQQLGVGARGLDTPAEREFMMKVLTGDISMTRGAIIKMAQKRRAEAVANINIHNSAYGSEKSPRYKDFVDQVRYGIVSTIDIPEEYSVAPSNVKQSIWNALSQEQRDSYPRS